jgi:glutamate dehydrogenase
MTGGPDGDVAGNELNILYREYGERCRVVAIGDGFGAAYDPKGLNWGELIRLFKESKSIVEFNPNKLSGDSKAYVISANSKENIKIRDNLYAIAEAEIFIPAGGRPYTVKESNWDKFLLPNGSPSALAIVEGANIFFTKEARQKIVDSGVIVIKDSSANKAGVSCSSYEIIDRNGKIAISGEADISVNGACNILLYVEPDKDII